MKRWCIIYFMLLMGYTAYPQNLVPNPGFEDFTNCPTGMGQVQCPINPISLPPTVKNWLSPIPNSPDYYNGCSPDLYATVPNNYYGYKPAHTGNAYAGIVIYIATVLNQPINYVEYLQVKLDSALRPGQRYLVSCYAKPAFYRDSSSTINHMAAIHINAGFSAGSTLQQSPPILILDDVEMRKKDGTYIIDTVNWTYISGYYTARGGEEWLTLGTFYNKYPSLVHLFPPDGVPTTTYQSYYLIDDVSVTAALPCDTSAYTHDTTVCNFPARSLTLKSTDTNAINYKWNNGSATKSIVADKGGIYWCTATDDCDIVTDTFRVSFFADTVSTSIEYVTCDTVHTLSGPDNAARYLWSTGDTTKTITVYDYGSYTCTSVVNCVLHTDNTDIGENPAGKLEEIHLGRDTTVCKDTPLQFGKAYPSAKSYLWNTGDTVCCISPTRTGIYTLTVSDECYQYNDSIDIKITGCSNCIFVPDAFTPNKDGLNDYFGVIPSCDISSFAIQIYNRWGQQVFSAEDIRARWNGLHKADFAQTGTYYYYMEYTTVRTPGEIITQKGSIILLR